MGGGGRQSEYACRNPLQPRSAWGRQELKLLAQYLLVAYHRDYNTPGSQRSWARDRNTLADRAPSCSLRGPGPRDGASESSERREMSGEMLPRHPNPQRPPSPGSKSWLPRPSGPAGLPQVESWVFPQPHASCFREGIDGLHVRPLHPHSSEIYIDSKPPPDQERWHKHHNKSNKSQEANRKRKRKSLDKIPLASNCSWFRRLTR